MTTPRRSTTDVCLSMNGGPGNQLFALAAAIGVTGSLERVYALPNHETDRVEAFLGIQLQRANRLRRLASRTARRSSRVASLTSRTRDRHHRRFFVHQPPTDAFAARPDLTPPRYGQLLLDGYFQHPTWFESGVDTIAALIRTTAPNPEPIEATTIHIRRGDYVRYGVALPLGYYEAALESLPSNDLPITVIGDDSLACELFASELSRRGFHAHSRRTGSTLGDFYLISRSRNVVMSNSTFCWWAVVANVAQSDPTDRTIIAPETWLPDPASSCLLSNEWNMIALPTAWEN